MFSFFREPIWIVTPADGAAAQLCAGLHERSFARGWSAQEFEALLSERQVVADLLHDRRHPNSNVGFALSRFAADEAELCSIAVAPECRRKGGARALLAAHLARLARVGVRRVALEVDRDNAAARTLYARFGFAEIGRRPNYYRNAAGEAGTALVLARPLDPPSLMDGLPALP